MYANFDFVVTKCMCAFCRHFVLGLLNFLGIVDSPTLHEKAFSQKISRPHTEINKILYPVFTLRMHYFNYQST